MFFHLFSHDMYNNFHFKGKVAYVHKQLCTNIFILIDKFSIIQLNIHTEVTHVVLDDANYFTKLLRKSGHLVFAYKLYVQVETVYRS